MSTDSRNRVCPVELAGGLDNRIRGWLQNPRKILKPYLTEGMTVLDIGCGPGFFSIAIAQMVGKSGRVIAADLQEGMLQKVKTKIQGTSLATIITLHKCEANRINLTETVDFVMAFYMVHEVPDQEGFFREIGSVLKPGGRMLIVEPPFHVSKKGFEDTLAKAKSAGLTPVDPPKGVLNRIVCLRNN
jgi:ubiquinone/menaquinone biosynthesis C-methylase UbiE